MAGKNGLTTEQEAAAEEIRAAAKAIAKAKSVDELREVWKAHLKLGHKILGRLFLSGSPETVIAKKFKEK